MRVEVQFSNLNSYLHITTQYDILKFGFEEINVSTIVVVMASLCFHTENLFPRKLLIRNNQYTISNRVINCSPNSVFNKCSVSQALS